MRGEQDDDSGQPDESAAVGSGTAAHAVTNPRAIAGCR
jgi:hypothetical protein